MNKKLEDNLGKLVMLVVFGAMAVNQAATVVSLIQHRAEIPAWQLSLMSLVASTIFLFLILFYTLTRLPPRDTAAGVEPRLTAIAGTFIMTLIVVLPPGTIGPELRLLSAVMIILGTILSGYCIRRLGRSFSIMATARKLVVDGPYRIIRHPLYGAELVTIIGIAIGHWSIASTALTAVWLALQIRRAQNEERVLRAAFPEYSDYARDVPMLLPTFMLPNLRRA